MNSSNKAPVGPNYSSYVLRLFLSLLLICLILQRVDFHKALAIMERTRWLPFAAACFLILLGALPGAWAWKILLRVQGMEVSLFRLTHLNLSGYFFNSYLPTGVGGDIWRCYTAVRGSGNSGACAASFIMERITAFAAVIILGVASFFLNMERFRQAGILPQVSVFFGVMLLTLLIGVLLTPWLLRKGSWILDKIFPGILAAPEAVESYKKSTAEVACAILIMMLSPLLECGAYVLLLVSLNLRADFLPVLMLVPLLRFINHIPVSVNSLGTQDLALLLFWKPLGFTGDQALSISLMMHLLRLLAGAFGALVYVIFPYKGDDLPPDPGQTNPAASEADNR